MKEHLLERTQIIPASREKVFAFFSDPRNLEMITPPWLHFKILTHPLPQGGVIISKFRGSLKKAKTFSPEAALKELLG